MSPKQKRALAALILAAIAGGLAAFAPGISCDVDEAVIEDLIPDEPASSPPQTTGAGSSDEGGAGDAGSSGSESSSTDGAGSSSGG